MLETLFGLLCAGSLTWLLLNMERRTSIQFWQDAVESVGLQVVEATPGWNPQLKARAELMEMRIRPSGEAAHSRIAVKVAGPPDFHKVRVRPQAMYQFTHEIEIGDAPFDGEFAIDGPARLVAALLDEGTRRLLSRLSLAGRLDLSQGEIRMDLPDPYLSQTLPLLLDLGKRLAEPLDVTRRLAENARQDPVAGVRLHNLLVLLRELPGDPVTAEALRAGRTDPSLDVRLRLAKQMGPEGRVILRELAEGLENDAVSAEAVSALGRALPIEDTTTILGHASGRRLFRTARACLKNLGATGSPAAEPPLLEALRSDQGDLRVAAANALGRVGSVAAVLPLQEAAERFRLGETHHAARQAIAAIQSRLQGATPGQLSLAGTEAGQLSLAETETGRLSLASDPAGRLSLGEEED